MAKERPILFSGEMVNAIMSGGKRQTRRIVDGAWHEAEGYLQSDPEGEDDLSWYFACCGIPASFVAKCPFGKAGDRLWVREKFLVQPALWTRGRRPQPIHYAADSKKHETEGYVAKSSIHMPKWASRISLEIVAVRVERLQTISEGDALEEVGEGPDPVSRFRRVWQSIHGDQSWDDNPWVWVIKFSIVDKGQGKEGLDFPVGSTRLSC